MLNFSIVLTFLFFIIYKIKKYDLFYLLSFSIIFGFIFFPFKWDTFGEQYYDYGIFLEQENVYEAVRAHAYTIMPLFYNFIQYFRDLFNTNSVETINLTRYLIFFFSLVSIYYFAKQIITSFKQNNISYSKRYPLYAAFFICVQWSFAYLVAANQFRQFFAFPLLFLGFSLFLQKKYILSFVLLSLAYYSHGSSLLVILLFFTIYLIRNLKHPIVIGFLLILFCPIFFLIIKNYILVFFPYYDGRLEYSVYNILKTGVGYGFYLLTAHYIWIILFFITFAQNTLQSPLVRLIFYIWCTIFSFWLFPLFGIPFAEPARAASILAPFSALIAGIILMKTKLFFRLIFFIEMILAYYFLTDYSGLGREFRLVENLLILDIRSVYQYSFNSDILFFVKFLFLSISLFLIGKLFVKKNY